MKKIWHYIVLNITIPTHERRTTPAGSKSLIRVRRVCYMTQPINFRTYPWRTTILVTNRWNRSHLSWIFSKFLTFTLHTFVLTQICRSPSPMLSGAYFGALKWLQTQINIGEGKITQVFQDLWRGLQNVLPFSDVRVTHPFTYILLKGINDLKNLRARATRNRTQAAAKTIIQLSES